jgi:neurotransmitter:Na+ symporter, NSS family
MEAETRGFWKSRMGFILAATGSAVGLGNIWRFPYVTGENGGAVFVLIYIGCVFLVGIPIFLAELSLGRHSRRNPIGAFKIITPNSNWKFTGYLFVITGLFILSYYLVIAGWTFGYIFKTIFFEKKAFEEFASHGPLSLGLFVTFLIFTIYIVYGGIEKGIERWSKILMPLLPLLLLIIIIYTMRFPGAMRGIFFYLKPDFSQVTAKTFLVALGQAFFSLSLGMGAIMTYGSYLKKSENMVTSALTVVIFDIGIALLAGFAIFPAIFAMGKTPAEGAALVFIILPEIFSAMPGGIIIGTMFFILLSIAALTSAVSLFEVPVSFLIDEKKINRRSAVFIVAAVVLLLGIPSALSAGGVDFLTDLPFWQGTAFLDMMDFIFGTIALPLGGIMITIYVGWKWTIDKASREIAEGNHYFLGTQSRLWGLIIRYICPLIILVILSHSAGMF